jgi:hypothetical protein
MRYYLIPPGVHDEMGTHILAQDYVPAPTPAPGTVILATYLPNTGTHVLAHFSVLRDLVTKTIDYRRNYGYIYKSYDYSPPSSFRTIIIQMITPLFGLF